MKYMEKNLSQFHLVHNPMCTGWDLKPGLHCERPVTNNMHHGMAPQKLQFEHSVPRLIIEFLVLPNTIQQYSPVTTTFSLPNIHIPTVCLTKILHASPISLLHIQVLQCEGTHCTTICNAVCPKVGSRELGSNSK